MKLSPISLILSAVIVLVVLLALVVPACQFAPGLLGPVCPVVFQLAGVFGSLLGYLTFAFYLFSDLAAGVLSNVTARYVLATGAVAFFAFLCYRLGGRVLWLGALFVLALPLVFQSSFIKLLAGFLSQNPRMVLGVCGSAVVTVACIGPAYVLFVLFPSAIGFKLLGVAGRQMQLREAKVALRTIGAVEKAADGVESSIRKGTDPTGLVEKLPFAEEVIDE